MQRPTWVDQRWWSREWWPLPAWCQPTTSSSTCTYRTSSSSPAGCTCPASCLGPRVWTVAMGTMEIRATDTIARTCQVSRERVFQPLCRNQFFSSQHCSRCGFGSRNLPRCGSGYATVHLTVEWGPPSVADPYPGSGAFLTTGSVRSFSGSRIPNL